MYNLRREFLRRISFLPFGLGLRPTTPILNEEPNDVAPVKVALNVVRLFNTSELHFHLKQGGYATKDELFNKLSASRFTDPRKDRAGSEKSFYSYLRLNDDEIVPGWKMQISKYDDDSGYTLSLIRTPSSLTGPTQNTVFVTDQIGVIYLGDSDVQYDPEFGPRQAAAVPGLQPIDTKLALAPGGLLGSVLYRFAFAAQGGGCMGPCDCNCTCRCVAGQCLCSNTGCQKCSWCCTGFCSSCLFCSPFSCACC